MSEPTMEVQVTEGECLLELNGQFFGYDNHPAHPETFLDNPKDAYIFKSPSEAFKTFNTFSPFEDERYKYRIITPKTAKKTRKKKIKGETVYTVTSGGYISSIYKSEKSRNEKLDWYHQNRPDSHVYPGEMILED